MVLEEFGETPATIGGLMVLEESGETPALIEASMVLEKFGGTPVSIEGSMVLEEFAVDEGTPASAIEGSMVLEEYGAIEGFSVFVIAVDEALGVVLVSSTLVAAAVNEAAPELGGFLYASLPAAKQAIACATDVVELLLAMAVAIVTAAVELLLEAASPMAAPLNVIVSSF
jgi:hypothetical protein